ncbi:MAG: DUF1501 domain-containing protein [Verrucomicrobiales bacterium]|nr:DUF1501 domain-containing protein [Verrucomicrobiales bacterium]
MKPTVVSRRTALSTGAGVCSALSLPSIFQLRANSPGFDSSRSDTTVILVNLGGGPSQHETYDPKPDAPPEYRGPFSPISTKIPGVQICELLPKQAAMMDQMTIIRSIHHEQASHIAEHIVETGYDLRNPQNSLKGEMPSVGSVVSAIRGSSPDGIPAYVSMPDRKAYGGPHWLGGQHRHFSVNDDPNEPDFAVKNLVLARDLDVERLQDRKALLKSLDHAQRAIERDSAADAIDGFTRKAFELITGPKAREAFDLSAEPDAMRNRYGRTTFGQRMLLARRLAEAQVPYIKVWLPGWDDHKDLVKRITPRAAAYDQALTALITDLGERGLTQKVLVVAMGEFGRTPKFNATGGRDHWPRVNSVLFAGGDYKMGQVIGATDRKGANVIEAPYRPQNVLGMMYRHLGIDPSITFDDFTGRPRYLLEERRPITELI